MRVAPLPVWLFGVDEALSSLDDNLFRWPGVSAGATWRPALTWLAARERSPPGLARWSYLILSLIYYYLPLAADARMSRYGLGRHLVVVLAGSVEEGLATLRVAQHEPSGRATCARRAAGGRAGGGGGGGTAAGGRRLFAHELLLTCSLRSNSSNYPFITIVQALLSRCGGSGSCVRGRQVTE